MDAVDGSHIPIIAPIPTHLITTTGRVSIQLFSKL
jgi:hypothetical protein